MINTQPLRRRRVLESHASHRIDTLWRKLVTVIHVAERVGLAESTVDCVLRGSRGVVAEGDA